LFVYLFVLVVLGFEFRASALLGRCFTTWITPPAPFWVFLLCFWMRLAFKSVDWLNIILSNVSGPHTISWRPE
jgi:hypothetical protein